jgi:ABC-2 type transport system ATP-binding protein
MEVFGIVVSFCESVMGAADQTVVSFRPQDAEAPPSAVAVHDVWKWYRSGYRFRSAAPINPGSQPALKGVSFSIPRGGIVGLLGPNGAGKTTLLKVLSTLIEVDKGSVFVLGHDVTKDSMRIRGRIGLVTSDERSFYWRLTGRQNLRFFATLYGLPAKHAKERIEMLFETLGLTEAADRPYYGYSTGMRQKLAIGRGLLSSPELVFYDEPTRSLDPLSAHNIRQWILANVQQFPGTTHFIATNQLHEAEQLCDRVIILNRGEIISDGSIADIRKEFEKREHVIHRITCRGFSLEAASWARNPAGMIDIQESPAEDVGAVVISVRTTIGGEALSFVLDTILRCGGTVLRCQTDVVPLDEIFRSLVTAKNGGERP